MRVAICYQNVFFFKLLQAWRSNRSWQPWRLWANVLECVGPAFWTHNPKQSGWSRVHPDPPHLPEFDLAWHSCLDKRQRHFARVGGRCSHGSITVCQWGKTYFTDSNFIMSLSTIQFRSPSILCRSQSKSYGNQCYICINKWAIISTY